MELDTQEIGLMEKLMAKEQNSYLTEQFMMDLGKMESSCVVFVTTQMERPTKANGLMESLTGEASRVGQTAESTTACGPKESQLAKEEKYTQMEEPKRATGKKEDLLRMEVSNFI
jgi:hypothetical protein